jgi:tetratricopeptide (TPR) repeat protein
VKDSLRINLRLTEVKSARAVLAEELGGSYDDFFDLQDTFAMRVIEAVRVKLTDREKAAVFQKPTKSPSAYALYNSSLSTADASSRIRLLSKALEQDPGFLQALHLLADTYAETGRAEEAVQTYRKILSAAPQDFKALYNSSLLFFDLGNLPGARERMLSCASIKPADPDVWYHLGLFQEYDASGERQGPGADLGKSRGYYLEAVARDPNHLEATYALGLLEALFAQAETDPVRQRDLLASSVDRFESYLRIHPAAVNAAEVRENLDLLREALRQIRGALEGK